MMELIWKYVTGKQFSAILYTLIMIWEVRHGFLAQFPAYRRTVQAGFYLKVFLLSVFATGLFLFFDSIVIQEVHTVHDQRIINLINFGVPWGRSGKLWSGLGILYVVLALLRCTTAKTVVFGCLVSSGLTSLFVHILKYVFVRARPEMGLGPYHFFDFQGFLDYGSKFLSFSSGDVAIAAGAMSFLVFAFKSPLKIVFPAVAILTCLSRMYEDKHWPSDVAFSFGVSFIFAKYVWDYLKFKFPEFAASSKEPRSRS